MMMEDEGEGRIRARTAGTTTGCSGEGALRPDQPLPYQPEHPPGAPLRPLARSSPTSRTCGR